MRKWSAEPVKKKSSTYVVNVDINTIRIVDKVMMMMMFVMLMMMMMILMMMMAMMVVSSHLRVTCLDSIIASQQVSPTEHD